MITQLCLSHSPVHRQRKFSAASKNESQFKLVERMEQRCKPEWLPGLPYLSWGQRLHARSSRYDRWGHHRRSCQRTPVCTCILQCYARQQLLSAVVKHHFTCGFAMLLGESGSAKDDTLGEYACSRCSQSRWQSIHAAENERHVLNPRVSQLRFVVNAQSVRRALMYGWLAHRIF